MKVSELLNLFEDIASKQKFLAKNLDQKLVNAYEIDVKKDASALDIMSKLSKADPSKSGSALTFLANCYASKQFKMEDLNRIKADLTKFEKFKSKITNKDLNSYKTLAALYDVIEQFDDNTNIELSNKQKIVNTKKDVTYLVNDPDFKALIPKTEEAACIYGAGTKWCTAARENNMFKHYNDEGPLVIIIAGEGKDIKKFQFHPETDSYMNSRDTVLSKAEINFLSEFNGYKKLLDILIKKHYF